jgi:putative ATPase
VNNQIPLAERRRPKTLAELTGQQHLVGPDGPIRKILESKYLPSMIFWGPPGVGKTTLAQIISNSVKRPFYGLSAINSGVKDIRDIINKVKNQGLFGGNNAILFIDEIHRFSKSQQDSLLDAVEKGVITLIGATTENPSFEVISALLSRCQVYILKHLTDEELLALAKKTITEDPILSQKNIVIKETEALLQISGGDGRKLQNTLEIISQSSLENDIEITNDLCMSVVQKNLTIYDKGGEMHYDIISAFIKSIRGSDPDAAVYWLARMVEGGEDPKFIARRLIILASEDIGLANPTALVMANNCFQAVNVIGWPESRIILSQCCIYLACSDKSNSAYMAINNAQAAVKISPNDPVPLGLRNAPTKLMKDIGYGNSYKYSHDYNENFVKQNFLPDKIKEKKFYEASSNLKEEAMKAKQLKRWGK